MYTRETDRELMQLLDRDGFNLSMVRIREHEHGITKCIYYKTELLDGRESIVLVSRDTNIERAFYIYDTLYSAVLFGRNS